MKLRLAVVIIFCGLAVFFENRIAAGDGWLEERGQHFILYYSPYTTKTDALKILRRAEDYYRKIGNYIGYRRYSNFWTWDERVKIYIYPNQQSFVQQTGQPPWSQGFSVREKYLQSSRSIVSYPQEEGLYEEILPHEISHLILRDFLGPGINIPIWFDEGVAQLQEEYKQDVSYKMMRSLVRQGQYIKFPYLFNWDIRGESDNAKVMVFYAQSLSIVDFMITQYGSSAFGRLCREMHEGKTFEEALKSTYTNTINTIDKLEKKWIRYIKR